MIDCHRDLGRIAMTTGEGQKWGEWGDAGASPQWRFFHVGGGGGWEWFFNHCNLDRITMATGQGQKWGEWAKASPVEILFVRWGGVG